MVGQICRLILLIAAITVVFSVPALAQETTSTAQQQYDDGETESTGQQLPSPEPSDGCANPTEVASFQGTETRRSDPFDVAGDVLRIRFTYISTDPEDDSENLVIRILEPPNNFVDSRIVFEPSSGTQNVLLDSPGQYFVEIEGEDVSYEVAIDDCGSVDGSAPGPPENPGGGEKIIMPPGLEGKKLADTGGLVLLLPLSAVVMGAGLLGFAVVRRRG